MADNIDTIMEEIAKNHPLSEPQDEKTRAANIKKAKDALIITDAVVFDVERTIIKEHCVNQLAIFLGKEEGVEEYVDNYALQVHDINIALTEIFEQLEVTREHLEKFFETFPYTFVPGVEAFIAHLKSVGVEVYLATEGIEELIYPIADKLNIPRIQAYGTPLDYSEKHVKPDLTESTYKLFSPYGKVSLTRRMTLPLREPGVGPRHKHCVFIGDAYNDALTEQFSDATIAFIGVHKIDHVVNKSHWAVESFEELLAFHKANRKDVDTYTDEEYPHKLTRPVHAKPGATNVSKK